MKILGINLAEHGSICSMIDGQIGWYLEAERITRVKYDFQVSRLFDFCEYPDYIALADCDYSPARVGNDKNMFSSKDVAKVKRIFPEAKVIDYRKDHHLTHAAVAYYNSYFLEAAVVVVDGNGSDGECESIFHVSHNEFMRVHKRVIQDDNPGIGKLFEEVAVKEGFDHRDAGKVMGLASYGKGPSHEIQTLWESRMRFLVEKAIRLTGCNNVCLSGGCFLNCTADYKLIKSLPKHVKIYTEPVSHDGGTSIGAAYLVHYDSKFRYS